MSSQTEIEANSAGTRAVAEPEVLPPEEVQPLSQAPSPSEVFPPEDVQALSQAPSPFLVPTIIPGVTEQEAKDLLLGALRPSEWSYWATFGMSVCLFIMGLIVVGIGLWLSSGSAVDYRGYLVGAGGLLTSAGILFFNPMRYIRGATTDQLQIKAVFLGYWSQLANWRTYLVRHSGNPDLKTVEAVNRGIEAASRTAVRLLEKYTESPPESESPRDHRGLTKKPEDGEE